jgi:glycerol kinase
VEKTVSLFLSVDQSTSATKAILFDSSGQLLDQVALEHRQLYPQPGWVEHDAEEIYQNLLAVAGLLLKRRPEAQSAVGLSITNQRETFVLFDAATGQPLHNAVVWQCVRGEPLCRTLREAGHEPALHAVTGLKIDSYFPAAKVRALLDQRPDLAERLANGTALFGTIDTYLVYRLTGGAVYASDHTNASRTLLYDIQRCAWSTAMCRLFGLDFARLPELRESSAHFGVTDLGGQLVQPLPICGIMGDSQAALFAQRCFAPGEAKVTFGTGSSLLLNVGSAPALPGNGIVTALAWVLDGRPVYAYEGITNFTGATIAWLRDQLGLIQSAEESEALARSVPDNGGVYLVPAFVGLSAPYWRPDARAIITGLTPGSRAAHVVRAGLESIAMIVADVLGLMESEAGLTLERIHGDGGAVRNRFLMQRVADVTQRTVLASQLPELSALGATLMGMLGTGQLTLAEVAALPAAFDQYAPSIDAAAAAELWAGWRHAVTQALA